MTDETSHMDAMATVDWRSGLENDAAELVQQKGWHSPQDILTSYRHLEKMLGSDRLSIPSKDAEPEAWGAIWEKLGRPAAAEGYQLSAPKGVQYDALNAQWFCKTAFELGLTQSQAQKLHDAFIAKFSHHAAPEESQEPQAPQEEALDLKTQWGRQYDRNMTAARRAYSTFIGDAAQFNDIADGMGAAALLDFLAKVGLATSEDSITSRVDGQTSGPRSASEAVREITRLQNAAQSDPKHPYMNKTHPDHAALVKRMEDLFAVAYGKA